MENSKKCPACGTAVAESTPVCPVCGLPTPIRRFVSKAAQEEWLKTVVLPFRGAQLRVFAGGHYGLILTGDGRLYGIGSNSSGQIDEQGPYRYDQPRLMAKDVISAAAGNGYSIYVTRDGNVHLRGRGELAERFTGFSQAREVYAGSRKSAWADSFWIRDRQDRVWCFGENYDEALQPRTRDFRGSLPELVATTSYKGYREENHSYYYFVLTGSIVWWEKNGAAQEWDWSAEDKVRKAPQYRALADRYGDPNVEIELNSERIGTGKTAEGYNYAERERFRPKLYVANNILYRPVLCPDAGPMIRYPHRVGCLPISAEDLYSSELRSDPGKKVVCSRLWRFGCDQLSLREDSSVRLYCKDEQCALPDWLQVPVADLGLSRNFLIVACRNGDILWKDDPDFPDKEPVNRFRLAK